MQCPSCKAEWNLSNSKSQQMLSKCPFCGEQLAVAEQKPVGLTGISEIIRSLTLHYGKQIYERENSQRFKALLSDLAVNFPKERKLLNVAILEGIADRLFDCDDESDDRKYTVMSYCKKDLVEENCIVEAAATDVVNILADGLGWALRLHEELSKAKKLQDKLNISTKNSENNFISDSSYTIPYTQSTDKTENTKITAEHFSDNEKRYFFNMTECADFFKCSISDVSVWLKTGIFSGNSSALGRRKPEYWKIRVYNSADALEESFLAAPEFLHASKLFWTHDDKGTPFFYCPHYPDVRYCPACYKKLKKSDNSCPNCGY